MASRPGPLGHVRVLDLGTEIGVPLAARWLGDLGADVIKVESEAGDPLRYRGPFADDDRERHNGGLFDYVNSNKRSLVASLSDKDDLALVHGLALGAELILEDLGPGGLEGLGLAPAELRHASPRLSVIRLSSFGQTGPYADRPASGLTIQAAAGYVKQFGWPPSPPVQIGGRFDEYVAAVYTAAAAMTALAGLHRLGGVDVDVSRMECAHSTLTFPVGRHRAADRAVPDRGRRVPRARAGDQVLGQRRGHGADREPVAGARAAGRVPGGQRALGGADRARGGGVGAAGGGDGVSAVGGRPGVR
jgi:crotonobetainyl-CoA:carnitine CoA-transferase CaiB-like acyl-CoA transferase